MAEILMQLEPEVRQYHLHLLQQQLTAPAVHGSSRQQLPFDDLLHQTQNMVPSDDPLHQAQIKHTTPQRDGLLHQSDDLLHQHTATQRDGLLHQSDDLLRRANEQAALCTNGLLHQQASLDLTADGLLHQADTHQLSSGDQLHQAAEQLHLAEAAMIAAQEALATA